jgi:hypothetical protein
MSSISSPGKPHIAICSKPLDVSRKFDIVFSTGQLSSMILYDNFKKFSAFGGVERLPCSRNSYQPEQKHILNEQTEIRPNV